MFIPKNPSTEHRSRAREILLGVGDRAIRRLVMTPFRAVFSELSKQLVKIDSGWWPSCAYQDKLVTLCPQGSAVLDGISALEPGCEVVFFGLCGSLGSPQVGEFFEVERAILGSRSCSRIAAKASPFKTIGIATVGCMTESFEKRGELAKQAACVDMETGYIFLAAKEQEKGARSFQVVSDHVMTRPFFEKPSGDPIAILTAQAGALLEELLDD